MNIVKALLFFFFIILINSSSSNAKRTPKILRGNDTQPGDYKYAVAIMHNGVNFTCGGGIIGERLILSAAHCFVDRETSEFEKGNYTVLAGTNDIYDERDPRRVVVEVEKIIVPRNYSGETYNDDIAVIKLKTPLDVKKNDLQILRLATETDIGNSEKLAVVAGFGSQKIEEVNDKLVGRMDGKLHSANVQVISNEDCVQTFREENMICGFMLADDDDTSEPYGVCNGDSGSPLVIESSTVIGVVSYADHVCDEQDDEPTYYTKVSAHSKFIDEAVVFLRTDVDSEVSMIMRMP